MIRRDPPPDVDALVARARALAGHTLGEIAAALGADLSDDGLRTKGKFGTLIEAALGASGGSGRVHDFPSLGVELKTIPIDARGVPFESTYVCTLPLREAETLAWEASWVKGKLTCVLFVPIQAVEHDWRERKLLEPKLWRPSNEDWAQLKSDFEELVGYVTSGKIESLTGRVGVVLQVRPKARDGSKSASTLSEDGDLVATVPKGFYLRASFTSQILQRA